MTMTNPTQQHFCTYKECPHAVDSGEKASLTGKEVGELVAKRKEKFFASTTEEEKKCCDNGNFGDGHVCQKSSPTQPDSWEAELQFEILEDYIREAELRHLVKDLPAYMERMRGHFEKLKSFIRRVEASAREENQGYKDGWGNGYRKGKKEGRESAVEYIRSRWHGINGLNTMPMPGEIDDICDAARKEK